MPKTTPIHPDLELIASQNFSTPPITDNAANLADFGLSFEYEETPDGGVIYEWYPGEVVALREPTGEDMLALEQFYLNGNKSSIEMTLSMVSFLHTSINGGPRAENVKHFIEKYKKLPLSKAMVVTKRIEVILKYFHFDDAMG
jgi:hypothetical protein